MSIGVICFCCKHHGSQQLHNELLVIFLFFLVLICREALSDFIEGFQRLELEEQRRVVESILELVQPPSSKDTQGEADDVEGGIFSAHRLDGKSCDSEERPARIAPIPAADAMEGQTGRDVSTSTDTIPSQEPNGVTENQEHVDLLWSLCEEYVQSAIAATNPGGTDHKEQSVCRRYLHHVLQACKNDIERAADEVLSTLEDGSFSNRLKSYAHEVENTQRKDQLITAHVDPELKKSIVNKYHLQAIPQGGEMQGARQKVKIRVPELEDKEKKSTVRYRDGQVVTTKGDKFIVVQDKPEWDGGSRGKVKSKRKGGKGWY